jgi:hypothetical protein
LSEVLPESLQSPATVVGNAQPVPIPGSQDSAPKLAVKVRDRVVVLGRTQAGKTIFLSSLYCHLWQMPEDISMKAIDGRTHKSCVDVLQTLREGRWPSSTVGSRYLDFEVSWRGITRPFVSLDYPGEVFRKAFIEGVQSPDVDELLDHIDRAAGVICLLDPAVVATADKRVSMDDDFGMLKAIERIRGWPGGESVPVAIVLTKFDVRHALIQTHGGPVDFVRKHYRALVAACPNAHVFTCTAVQTKAGQNGTEIAKDFESAGVVAPLRYVLGALQRSERKAAEKRARKHAQEQNQLMMEEEVRSRQRSVWLWTIGALLFVALMAGCGWIAYWISSR